MSKKKNPIVGVMEFFEGANLEAAQSALALAQAKGNINGSGLCDPDAHDPRNLSAQ